MFPARVGMNRSQQAYRGSLKHVPRASGDEQNRTQM